MIFVWNWAKLWENNLLAFSYDKIQRSVTQADIQETNLATQNSSRSSLSYSEHWAGNVLGTYSWPDCAYVVAGLIITENMHKYQDIVLCAKNLTQLYSNILLEKSSENDFIFLPAFYLNMCLIKAKKNFEKIANLKTRELVSFWGV